MARARQVFMAGAAAAVFAAGGVTALPASAARAGTVGSVFSGTVEIASTSGILVARKQRKGTKALIPVDTDKETVVSRAGVALSVEDLSRGTEVVVSGTHTSDGGVLASKILIRQA